VAEVAFCSLLLPAALKAEHTLAWHQRACWPSAISTSLHCHLKCPLLHAIKSHVVAHFSPRPVFYGGCELHLGTRARGHFPLRRR
jgi:hypothetical protein